MPTKVLIIEDDISLAQLYKVALEIKGYQVSVAHDGEEGMQLAIQEIPDVLLLDIMMPKVTGLELLVQIKDNPKIRHIPIIMLTNFGQEQNIKEAFDRGATEFILKYHITPEELAGKIASILKPEPMKIAEETSS